MAHPIIPCPWCNEDEDDCYIGDGTGELCDVCDGTGELCAVCDCPVADCEENDDR